MEIGIECWAVPAIDLFFPCLRVKVKWKVKWKKSESSFGPLIFFNLRYIKVGVKGNNSIGVKKSNLREF